jgi:hypothetical protein
MAQEKLVPVTGTIKIDYSRRKTEEVVFKVEAFSNVWVDTPYHLKLQSGLDTLRLHGRISKAKTHRTLRCLAPPSSGKSTLAENYRDSVNEQVATDKRHLPILFVSLENAMTSKKLIMSILHELGDPNSTRGVEQLLKNRMRELIQERRVELIIVDEIHHLASKSNVADVVNALKAFLNKKICPLALLGTSDGEKLLATNKELGQRNATVADIKPLPQTAAGNATLSRFLRCLDQELVQSQTFATTSDFTTERCVAGLMRVSEGVMGLSARILQNALEISIRRNASLIEAYDVSLAIDTWAIPNGFCKTNPFTKE